MKRDPFRELSPHVTSTVENSPQVDAMREGRKLVPDTWGTYASRTVEMGLCEPEEVVGFLGITDENLADPDLYFSDNFTFSYYERRFLTSRREVHKKLLKPEADRLAKVANAIVAQWEVPDQDEATQRAHAIQTDITDISIAERDMTVDDRDNIATLLCMERDGLFDGVEVTLEEYSQKMLTASAASNDSSSLFASHWRKGVEVAIDRVKHEHPYADLSDVPTSMIHLNRKQVGSVGELVLDGVSMISWERSQADWDAVQEVFYAPTSHPLIDAARDWQIQALEASRTQAI